MTARPRDSYPAKSDRDRRKAQSLRILEILKVHRLTGGRDVSVEEVKTITTSMGTRRL